MLDKQCLGCDGVFPEEEISECVHCKEDYCERCCRDVQGGITCTECEGIYIGDYE